MIRNKYFSILIVCFLLVSVVLSGCGGAQDAPSADEPVADEPVADAPSADEPSEDEAKEMPTKLNIAVVRYGTLEEPWERTFQEALDRVVAEKPYGLEISYDQTESVVGEDAIRVMLEYAESGRYQIIWSTEGAGVDYIQTMNKEFPEIIFAHPGPEQGLGDNDAWVQNLVYEAAYLQGYMAGMMTETNIIGFIGSFPGAEANTEGNAYIAGATEANPDVKVKVTFINSWWDPALAKEAAIAQIAADCDLIFPKVYGAFGS